MNDWTENMSVAEANLILSGACRENSTDGRLRFETGNWKGQKMMNEGRFFDTMYNRKYEPDFIKFLQY